MATPLKSYIDRVLNVLSEIDDLGTDKKNIYKELADEGYDRTVVAQVVGHIRKKAKKPGKFAEQSALFDLYLADYEGTGTVVATRTPHASSEDFDPETGEILDTNTARETIASTTAADPAGEADDASSADQSTAALTEVPGTAPDHQDLRDIADAPRSYPPEPQQKAAEHASSGSVAGAPAGTQAPPVDTHTLADSPTAEKGDKPESDILGKVAGQIEPGIEPVGGEVAQPPADPIPEPGKGALGESPSMASEPATEEGTGPQPSSVVPGRQPGCLNPDTCAGTWRKRCASCERAFMAVAAGGQVIVHQGQVG